MEYPLKENNIQAEASWFKGNESLTEEEVDEGEDHVGAVSYPKESVKKYKDLTEPSDDWADLSIDYNIVNASRMRYSR